MISVWSVVVFFKFQQGELGTLHYLQHILESYKSGEKHEMDVVVSPKSK